MKRGLFVLAMLAVPVAGAAQQGADDRIEAALRRVSAEGIPADLLRNRVAEGRAKRVPADRIAEAVERRASSLIRANQVMREAVGRSDGAELSAAADAIEAGIGAGAVAEIARSSGAEDRAVALAVLTYLHGQQGLPVDEALTRVQGALRQGPDALRTLPAQAAAARGRGRANAPGQAGSPAAGGGRGNSGAAGPPASVPGPRNPPGTGRPDNPGGDRGQGQGRGRQ